MLFGDCALLVSRHTPQRGAQACAGRGRSVTDIDLEGTFAGRTARRGVKPRSRSPLHPCTAPSSPKGGRAGRHSRRGLPPRAAHAAPRAAVQDARRHGHDRRAREGKRLRLVCSFVRSFFSVLICSDISNLFKQAASPHPLQSPAAAKPSIAPGAALRSSLPAFPGFLLRAFADAAGAPGCPFPPSVSLGVDLRRWTSP